MKTKLHLLLIAVLFSFSSYGQNAVISLTGSGVGGWGQDTDLTTTNGDDYTATNIEIVGAGGGAASSEIKFRLAHDWATSWGYDKGVSVLGGWPTDTGVSSGSTNIPAEPGFWNVTFNLTSGLYSFTPGVNPNHAVALSGAAITGGSANLSTKDGINYNRESVTIVSGGDAKFVEVESAIQPSPTANWSAADFPFGTGTQGGAAIATQPGTYLVSFVYSGVNAGQYNFDPTTVGIIGVGGDWNNDLDMDNISGDNIHYSVSGLVLSGLDNSFKFRDNHSWNFQFGQSVSGAKTGATGTAVDSGTQDFHLGAGTYDVTFNRTTYEYTFTNLTPNAAYDFTSTNSVGTIHLATVDGINYIGNGIKFDGAGSGHFNEVSSDANSGPSFATIAVSTPKTPNSGVWDVTLNINTQEFSFTPAVLGLIGDFAASGWGTDIDFTSTDGVNYTLNNVVFDKVRGGFKIRGSHGWNVQFGHAVSLVDPETSALSGTLVDAETKDMALPAGTYNFAFNRLTLDYTISSALAVDKFATKNFTVYPNPSQNSWNFVSAKNSISSVKIVDMLGRTVTSKNGSSNAVSVDAASLSKGTYFARITSGNSVETVKVMKN